MQQDEIWNVDAARRYDTPGTGMFAAEVLAPTVDCLTRLAGNGRALEFAIGTGRVAVPLSERGVPVTGIELSGPMIDRLRTKVDEETIPVVDGDMASAVAPGEFTLVYLVYNTISNLLTGRWLATSSASSTTDNARSGTGSAKSSGDRWVATRALSPVPGRGPGAADVRRCGSEQLAASFACSRSVASGRPARRTTAISSSDWTTEKAVVT